MTINMTLKGHELVLEIFIKLSSCSAKLQHTAVYESDPAVMDESWLKLGTAIVKLFAHLHWNLQICLESY